jgi:hypothetical protein
MAAWWWLPTGSADCQENKNDKQEKASYGLVFFLFFSFFMKITSPRGASAPGFLPL